MPRYIMSAKLEHVEASCGHKENVYIPPSGGRPGPVGRRNIAAAQSQPCWDCQHGLVAIAIVVTDTGHYYIGPDAPKAVADDARADVKERSDIAQVYVLPYDANEYPNGDADRAGEYYSYNRDAN